MGVQCGACGKFISPTEGVLQRCPQCNSISYHECVRLPPRAKIAASWRCGECQSRMPKGRDPSTPIRGIADSYSVAQNPSTSDEPMVLDDTAHNITAEFSEMELMLHLRPLKEELIAEFNKMQLTYLAELKSFKEEFRTHCTEMQELKKELSDLRSSITTCDKRVVSIEKRVSLMEQTRNSGENSGAITSLQQTISELKTELNDREQEYLLNDVEVTGLPEQKGENCAHIVSFLATAMGVNLDDRDIVSADRFGPMASPQQTGSSSTDVRPRKIVLRFARRSTRDEYLRAARVRRGLTSADIGVGGTPVRVYVNERLSRANRQLFAKSRETCRRNQWKYCWTKEGQIYVRKEHGSTVTRIRVDDDLERVFGASTV